jgi:sterol 3beta-glucosyltransferase
MRRILFASDGSSGDLLPIVLMAREFKLAGYEVCVCGSAELSPMAQDFGVPYEPYPHNYSKLYKGEYELLSKIAPDYDVVINFLADIFVPSIAEAFDLPNIKLFTFPVVVSDRYGPPAGLPFVSENKWVNRLGWRGAELGARHLFSYYDTINRLRGELNLPPIRGLLANNSRCDHMMIGLYKELMPPCKRWHDFEYSYIGPCLPNTRVGLSDDLEAFLENGSKPIYIGFGSMRHANGDQLTRVLLDAVNDTGVRAVIAQNSSEIGTGLDESENVFVLRDYPIPHHVLFPRLKAAVHHGSWITTHLAARAGIPQLVLPQANDQYLWSDILSKRGLGPKGVDMNRMKPKKLSAAIEQLTRRHEYESNARALAQRVAGIDGARNAVRLFETLKGRIQAEKRTSLAVA